MLLRDGRLRLKVMKVAVLTNLFSKFLYSGFTTSIDEFKWCFTLVWPVIFRLFLVVLFALRAASRSPFFRVIDRKAMPALGTF